MGRRQIQRPVPPQRRKDRPAGRLFASQTRTSDARPYILPVMLRRDEHCSSGIRNECNLLQANLTSRSPPRRKVAGRFHRGPQANPTCRIAETQPRTSDARPYIRFVTRSAWVRFGGRATTHRNCQLSIINDQDVRYSPMGSAELLPPTQPCFFASVKSSRHWRDSSAIMASH